MEHATDLTAIALVTAIALFFGVVLTRMKQPAVVGYIVAGVALGPTGLGLVRDSGVIRDLAELGVLMLLFILGMELSLRAFKTVYRIAVACALLQIVVSLGMSFLFGWLFGWRTPGMLLLGFVTATSSTAVAIKLLEELGELRTHIGRVTVGVLIAQDLAVVPMLLVLTSFGGSEGVGIEIAVKLLLAVGLLVALVWFLSRRERVRLPLGQYLRGRPDIAPLAALAACFTAATITGALGLSSAYGAFLAGLVIGSSTERKAALLTTLPIQSVLLVVFFLSIGLLIDLAFIWNHLGAVLTFLLVVTLLKTVTNVAILRLLRQPRETALLSGIVLGQVGEFAFVLASAAADRRMIDDDGYRFIIAVIALSLVTSPLWLVTARRLHELAWTSIEGMQSALESAFTGEILAVRRGWLAVRDRLQKRASRAP